MKTSIVSTLLISVLFTGSNAQKIGFGRCPNTQVVQGLNIEQYMGKWYEIKTYPNLFQSHICTEANYGPINELGQAQVINKELRNGNVQAIRGFAVQPRPSGGDLKVTLTTPFVGNTESDYDVLGTDYSNWALVHACRQVLGIKAEFAWVLSRTRELSFDDQQKIDQLIARNGLDLGSFRATQQADCPDIDTLPFSFVA